MSLPMGLLLLFVGLKLASVIEWAWWWVLSPIWIWFALGFLWFALVALVRKFESPHQRAARLMQEYSDALMRKP